ncbi:MAG: SDR family NAD(P)-dependent oxidoreductase [Chloroflexi bacterium]|nr:MAG: SDR family NAD(P)-dependent oxidoreductase [Chloroflexota bacterium]
MIMNKKICVITGANSGIGKAAAIQIMQEGVHVVLACRHQGRGEAALADIRQVTGMNSVELMLVDMSSQASIRAFAEAYLAKYDVLDVLIHNAAKFDVTQKKPVQTDEGIESIWATNHLGPVLMTDLLLDAIKRSGQGRIITVSSKGLIVFPFLKVIVDDPEFERRRFTVTKAYYQSKLAQVMYTFWLADKLGDTAVTVNSIRVTNVKIDIESRYPNASKFSKWVYSQKSKSSISPEEMAKTYTYLAVSDEVSKTTGTYYDDPTHIVRASNYSYDKSNIEQVMACTMRYLKKDNVASV